jgi:membrane-bound lytic murein transglycosylase MltF
MKSIPSYKGKLSLYFILLIIVIAIMLTLRTCSSDSRYSTKDTGNSSGDTLDVAIVYSPMSYYKYGDSLGGINYDLLRIMSRNIKRPIKFHPIISLNKALSDLDNGTFDILASLPVNSNMRDKYSFSESIYLDRQVLVQLKDKNGSVRIESSLDLANDTVHIEKDSPTRFRIENLSEEIGAPIYIKEHAELSGEYMFLKVASGDLPCAVINEKTALRLVKNHPEVSIDIPISFNQFQSWVTRKNDSTLVKEVDTWLTGYKLTNDYSTILRRYNNK